MTAVHPTRDTAGTSATQASAGHQRPSAPAAIHRASTGGLRIGASVANPRRIRYASRAA